MSMRFLKQATRREVIKFLRNMQVQKESVMSATQHPELKVVGQHRHGDGPCPSKAENKKWLADGAKWLFENFDIGGINLEMGDSDVLTGDELSAKVSWKGNSDTSSLKGKTVGLHIKMHKAKLFSITM